jgi:hypothetical protein
MDLDNIIQEYGVPMASGVHMEYPQKIRERKMIHRQPFYTIAEPATLGQEQVIEQMSGADGGKTASQNVQVIALEKQIKELTEQQTALMDKSVSLKSDLAVQQKQYDTLAAKVADCTWQGGWAIATKKYKCQGEFHSDAWKNQQIGWLNTYDGRIVALKKQIADNDNALASINTQLPMLQANLEKARTSASRSSMTPEELKNYDVAQTQAQAEAEAIKIQAVAEAASKKSKSKIFLIVGIAAGIALIGGLTFYFIKGRKKGVPTPVVKPVAPVIK